MLLQNSMKIQAQFPSTHFFIYKNLKFPFNLNLFNFFSDYFNTHMNEIQPDQSDFIKTSFYIILLG